MSNDNPIKTDVPFKADLDTSSMRGFVREYPEDRKKVEPKAYDVDSSSMRGYTSDGQPVVKL